MGRSKCSESPKRAGVVEQLVEVGASQRGGPGAAVAVRAALSGHEVEQENACNRSRSALPSKVVPMATGQAGRCVAAAGYGQGRASQIKSATSSFLASAGDALTGWRPAGSRRLAARDPARRASPGHSSDMPRSRDPGAFGTVHRVNARIPGRSAGASSIVYSNAKLASTISDRSIALRFCSSSVTCPRQGISLRPTIKVCPPCHGAGVIHA